VTSKSLDITLSNTFFFPADTDKGPPALRSDVTAVIIGRAS